MRLQYYADTDSLYIDLSEKEVSDSREIAEGLVVDFDESGNVAGLDIQHAKERLSLDSLEAISFPGAKLKMS